MANYDSSRDLGSEDSSRSDDRVIRGDSGLREFMVPDHSSVPGSLEPSTEPDALPIGGGPLAEGPAAHGRDEGVTIFNTLSGQDPVGVMARGRLRRALEEMVISRRAKVEREDDSTFPSHLEQYPGPAGNAPVGFPAVVENISSVKSAERPSLQQGPPTLTGSPGSREESNETIPEDLVATKVVRHSTLPNPSPLDFTRPAKWGETQPRASARVGEGERHHNPVSSTAPSRDPGGKVEGFVEFSNPGVDLGGDFYQESPREERIVHPPLHLRAVEEARRRFTPIEWREHWRLACEGEVELLTSMAERCRQRSLTMEEQLHKEGSDRASGDRDLLLASVVELGFPVQAMCTPNPRLRASLFDEQDCILAALSVFEEMVTALKEVQEDSSRRAFNLGQVTDVVERVLEKMRHAMEVIKSKMPLQLLGTLCDRLDGVHRVLTGGKSVSSAERRGELPPELLRSFVNMFCPGLRRKGKHQRRPSGQYWTTSLFRLGRPSRDRSPRWSRLTRILPIPLSPPPKTNSSICMNGLKISIASRTISGSPFLCVFA